jgi:hypothetical protein
MLIREAQAWTVTAVREVSGIGRGKSIKGEKVAAEYQF